MLPGIDGFAVCRRLRRQGVDTPVLILSARDACPIGCARSIAAPTTTW